MRLVFVAIGLVMVSANVWAKEYRTGELALINCVDGSQTADPEAYVSQTIQEWHESEGFAGIVLGDADLGEVRTNARRQADSFFTKGYFLDKFRLYIKNSKSVEVVHSSKTGVACLVKRGLISQETPK